MNIQISAIILVVHLFSDRTDAIDPTCRGKRVGEKCISDEDCEGPYYQCSGGKCTCPTDFEEFSLDEKLKVCRPARDEVDAKCQTKCKAPLLCQNGKCICFKGTVVGKKCTISCPSGQTAVGQECRALAASLGSECKADQDCTMANSFCNNRRCDCVSGAKRNGNICVITCNDGSAPTQACRLIMVNDANALANGDKQDSCPRGQACFTFGKPSIGHCCPLFCPHGSADLTKSCAPGAPDRCPEQSTHFCESFAGHGVRNALCCPRPCREPTPLYINGACLPKAHWGDACKEDGQCEGGSAMQCRSGRCQCSPGFNQLNGTWATCQKTCSLLNQVWLEGQCRPKVGVGDPCLGSSMCPLRSICREGVCQCDCASSLSRNACVNPDDPLGVDSIVSNLGSFFGTGSKPGASKFKLFA